MFTSTDEIKKLIADHERMAAELKEMLAKKEAEETGQSKIPDNVRDVPTTYPVEAYSKTSDGKEIFGFHVNAVGAIIKDWHNITYDTTDTTCYNFNSNFTFPTYGFAEMFREKAQLITDCISFKWMYDRDYVPVWTGKRNSCITYDVRNKQYTVDTSSCFDDNSIYFSTQDVAEKCAEWLNYKYKKGEYSEADD